MAVIGPHTRALSQMWTSCIINYFIFRPHQSQKSKQSRQVIYRARFCDFLTITACSAFTRSYILIPLHIPLDLRDKHQIQTIANPTPKSPYEFIHSLIHLSHTFLACQMDICPSSYYNSMLLFIFYFFLFKFSIK